MDPVAQIIANLRSWRGLPGYSVERRLDVLLTPFLPGFLSEAMGGQVELVTAEFPLPKVLFEGEVATRQHISADFLCVRRGQAPSWILVELKTDAASKRAKQDHAYRLCAAAGMTKILASISESKKGTVHEREYEALARRVKHVARSLESVEVCYLEPKVGAGVAGPNGFRRASSAGPTVDAATGAITWSFGLGRFARHIGDGHPFARMLQKVLRGIARSEKARRQKDRRKRAA
jgi:hypothetical protein